MNDYKTKVNNYKINYQSQKATDKQLDFIRNLLPNINNRLNSIYDECTVIYAYLLVRNGGQFDEEFIHDPNIATCVNRPITKAMINMDFKNMARCVIFVLKRISSQADINYQGELLNQYIK